MARPRVYRHDPRRPDCGSNWMRKDGFTNGKQAYNCGDCRWRSVPGGAFRRPGTVVKERGLALYLEGNSLSAISRLLGYSVPAVSGWVKKGGAWRRSGCGNGTGNGRREPRVGNRQR